MREEGWGGSRAQVRRARIHRVPPGHHTTCNARKRPCASTGVYGTWPQRPSVATRSFRPHTVHHSLVIAVSYNFVGSPHIDTYDIAPQYALSLGDFTQGGGGELCVEESAMQVAVVDTRGKVAKVDGRFPHWVLPYTGERFSIIWFQTRGVEVPRTRAVFDEAGRET